MKINSTNIQSFTDVQRQFEHLKFELEKYNKINTYTPDYGMFSFPGNPYTDDLSNGARIPNNYIVQEGSGTIINNPDYTYTLNENRLYELNASIVCLYSTNTNSFCAYRWYDEELKEYFGTRPYTRPTTFVSNVSVANDAMGFIRTTKKQKISLKINSSTNLTGLYGANGDYAYMIIKEIARF